jgi:two-component system chemotaxis response regulator CheY
MTLKADMKILVVDDMATMRKVIKNMLNQMGLKNVSEADDGKTALPLIQNAYQAGDPFEFIMSDWNMPGMTGLDLLKTLKASNEFKDVPFLMITAEAEQQSVIAAVKAGVTNFIVKPFSAQILRDKIDKIFNKGK